MRLIEAFNNRRPPPLLCFQWHGLAWLAALIVVNIAVAQADEAFVALAPIAEEYDAARNGQRKLYDLVRDIRERRKVPSLWAAIVTSDGMVAQAATGVRKVGSPEPVTIADRIHLGSCTKAMTASLCGLLVEDGKLGWDRTLGTAFPDLGELHTDYVGASLEELLRHRSGLPANGPWEDLGAAGTTTEQREELVRRLLLVPADHKRGEFLYSNAGYAIAGLMAERAEGKSWEELMRSRVFEPLDMKTAGFGPPGTPGEIDEPWGHERQEESFKPVQVDNPASLGPAGTVHVSMADWGKFVSAHLRGLRGGDTVIGKTATIATQHEPSDDDKSYAMGWLVVRRGWAISRMKPPEGAPPAVQRGRAHTHSGSNTTWGCVVWMAPGADFAVLAATNVWGDAAMSAIDEVAAGAIGRKLYKE